MSPVFQLRACLGWQIVACGASVFNLICCFLKMDFGSSFCWYFLYDSDFSTVEETCKKIEVSCNCLLVLTIFSCFIVGLHCYN